MRALLPIAVLLLSGCSNREAECDKAVRSQWKNTDTLEMIDFTEEETEGKALSSYRMIYKYRSKSSFPEYKSYTCIHDNNENKIEVYNMPID